jgi:hypothetical protein
MLYQYVNEAGGQIINEDRRGFGRSRWLVSILNSLGETEESHVKLTVMMNLEVQGTANHEKFCQE